MIPEGGIGTGKAQLKERAPKLFDYLQNKLDELIATNNEQSNPTVFKESQTSGYRDRTIQNASADVTIALATDFNTAGEKLTKSSV